MIRLHDPGPKDSARNQELRGAEVITPQVEFVIVELSDSNVHHGMYCDSEVQLKIIRSVSRREDALDGLVVMPRVTFSEK